MKGLLGQPPMVGATAECCPKCYPNLGVLSLDDKVGQDTNIEATSWPVDDLHFVLRLPSARED